MSNNFQQNITNNFSKAVTLDKAETNVDYIILSCNLPRPLSVRFAELGFVAGAKVTVNKKAPLGDPLELTIMGYRLCARANELKHVLVARKNK